MTAGSARRTTRRSAPALLACAALGWHFAAAGADIYESRTADGSVRYATEALDASYRFIASDSPRAPSTASPGRTSPIREAIARAAARHGVDAALVEAIAHVESRFHAGAVSPKGAVGVMQLMPATAKRYGLADAHALRDAERNIDAGVRHLKELLTAHQGNVALAIAAYNAGGGAVRRQGDRIPPYPETMLYVPSVLAGSARAPSP